MDKDKTHIIKAYGQRSSFDEESRTATFTISTEAVDRDGTVIKSDAWEIDNFNANPIVGYQHQVHGSFFGDSNPDNVIGLGRAYWEDGKLVGEVQFEPAELNELAEKIFQKVKFGSLRATSVGFMPKSGHWGDETLSEDPDLFYFTKCDLVEFSIVNIPSNPEALIRSANNDTINKFLEDNPKPEKVEEVTKRPKLEKARRRLKLIQLQTQ